MGWVVVWPTVVSEGIAILVTVDSWRLSGISYSGREHVLVLLSSARDKWWFARRTSLCYN